MEYFSKDWRSSIVINLKHFSGEYLNIPIVLGQTASLSSFSWDSLYITREHLSCKQFLLLFNVRLWNIQTSGQQPNYDLKEEFINIYLLLAFSNKTI